MILSFCNSHNCPKMISKSFQVLKYSLFFKYFEIVILFYYPWLIKNQKMNTKSKCMNLQLYGHKRYKKDTERSAGVWWNSGRREEYWLRTDFNLNSLSEIIKIHTWCQMQFSISSPGPSSLQGWGETGASHVHTSTKLRSNKNKCAVHF